jgi:hypothetical protein
MEIPAMEWAAQEVFLERGDSGLMPGTHRQCQKKSKEIP